MTTLITSMNANEQIFRQVLAGGWVDVWVLTAVVLGSQSEDGWCEQFHEADGAARFVPCACALIRGRHGLTGSVMLCAEYLQQVRHADSAMSGAGDKQRAVAESSYVLRLSLAT